MIYLIGLILALAVIILGTVQLKFHPFFVLLFAAILYGFITGMPIELIIDSINDGFGSIMGKIGLIILFGVVIGTMLEKSGGAFVIANSILNVIGRKSVYLAMMLTGYILSIPIFADSAFLMMNSLNKALSKKANASYAGTTVALALGLTASHVMVPPTPGPIAAAGILKADLGSVVGWGLLVSFLSLGTCYVFARKYASKITIPYKLEPVSNPAKQPKLLKSLSVIAIPLLLILVKSFVELTNNTVKEGYFFSIISFIGTPVIALLIGVILAFLLPGKIEQKIYSASGWIGDAVKIAAPIILITGAGGIFGKMLQNSGMTDTITGSVSGMHIGLFFPFLLAACLKTTQGSSTVALITTASIVAPILPLLGLTDDFSKTLTVLAIGAGSSVVSHANDSFFWVFTQLTGMNVKQGNQTQTLGTLVLGTTAMILIFIISQLAG